LLDVASMRLDSRSRSIAIVISDQDRTRIDTVYLTRSSQDGNVEC